MTTAFINSDGKLVATEDAKLHVSNPATPIRADIFDRYPGLLEYRAR